MVGSRISSPGSFSAIERVSNTSGISKRVFFEICFCFGTVLLVKRKNECTALAPRVLPLVSHLSKARTWNINNAMFQEYRKKMKKYICGLDNFRLDRAFFRVVLSGPPLKIRMRVVGDFPNLRSMISTLETEVRSLSVLSRFGNVFEPLSRIDHSAHFCM